MSWRETREHEELLLLDEALRLDADRNRLRRNEAERSVPAVASPEARVAEAVLNAELKTAAAARHAWKGAPSVENYKAYVKIVERARPTAILPSLVGVMGDMGAGKDTVGAMLSLLGYEPASLATALKRLCADLYGQLGAEERHFFGTQADKAEPIRTLGGATGREILQHVGDGFRKAFASTFIDRLFVDSKRGERLVVTDIRYPNEVEAIRNRGGVVWRVEKTMTEEQKRDAAVLAGVKAGRGAGRPSAAAAVEAMQSHQSETSVKDVEPDALISAPAGDMQAFADSVREALRK